MAKAWKKHPRIEAAWAERTRLRAESLNLRDKGDRLVVESNRLDAECDRLYADSNRLNVEGTKLYAEAVCWVNPKAVIDWTDGSFEIEEEA